MNHLSKMGLLPVTASNCERNIFIPPLTLKKCIKRNLSETNKDCKSDMSDCWEEKEVERGK